MGAKAILILVLVGFVLMGLVGLSGNAKLDAALGEGATARAEGQKAVLQAEADAIKAESAAKAEASRIANNDKEQMNQMTREKRAANQRVLNTLLMWSGGIGAAIALLGLGLSFAGYSAFMGLAVLPVRALNAPEIRKNDNVTAVWIPRLEQATIINSDMPGQVLQMSRDGSNLFEGQPGPMIAASQSRALAAAAKHMRRQRNSGNGFFEALEALSQQKALTSKAEDKDDQA